MKRLPIERLLRWAYHDELPKAEARPGFLRPEGFRSPGANLVRTGDLGQAIQEPDIRNRYGVVPDTTASGEPHEDAIRVWQAVQDLEGLELDLPDDWNPAPELAVFEALGAAAVVRGIKEATFRDAAGNLYLRRRLHQFVEHHIIMKTSPDWVLLPTERRLVCHTNGTTMYFVREVINIDGQDMEIEVDGRDKTRHKPKAGAYTKAYLDPSPVATVVGRIEYRVWNSALSLLAAELAGRLDAHDVVAPEDPAEPWESGGKPPVRVLKDLRTPTPAPKVVRRRRSKAA